MSGHPMNIESSLAAHAISWRRGDRQVLDGVSISAGPGTTTGLLGPNGSGKSSLLRILAGLAKPDTGTVTLDSRNLSTMRRRDVARSIAMVEQSVHTDIDVTVLDVVGLGRLPHRGGLFPDTDSDGVAINRVLAATGIEHLRNRYWHTLSGGERQRVQIARALAQEPQFLLLDEPTNHLDIQHQLDVLELVVQTPVTTYVALHDLNLAAMFCDRLVVLSNGRVVAAGTPSEVLTSDLIERVYHVQAVVDSNDDGMPTIDFRRRTFRVQHDGIT